MSGRAPSYILRGLATAHYLGRLADIVVRASHEKTTRADLDTMASALREGEKTLVELVQEFRVRDLTSPATATPHQSASESAPSSPASDSAPPAAR